MTSGGDAPGLIIDVGQPVPDDAQPLPAGALPPADAERPSAIPRNMAVPASPGQDSPNMVRRIAQLSTGEDPSKDSSPQGATLLARKAQRQMEQAQGELRRPGGKLIDSAEIEAMPPRPKLSGDRR